MQLTSNSDKITRDYFDSLLIETRYLDAVLPTTEMTLFGETFRTPIMTAALSHLHNTARNGMTIYAQGAARSGAVHWVGMGSDEELEEIVATGARTIKIMGEDGEIRASEAENVIEITRFASNSVDMPEREIIHPEISNSGHSGGDSGIVEDFLAILEGKLSESSTDIHESVESHMMACAAEEARITGSVVRIAEFRKAHERTTRA